MTRQSMEQEDQLSLNTIQYPVQPKHSDALNTRSNAPRTDAKPLRHHSQAKAKATHKYCRINRSIKPTTNSDFLHTACVTPAYTHEVCPIPKKPPDKDR